MANLICDAANLLRSSIWLDFIGFNRIPLLFGTLYVSLYFSGHCGGFKNEFGTKLFKMLAALLLLTKTKPAN